MAGGRGVRTRDHAFHVREASEPFLGKGVQFAQGVHVGSVVLGASDELPPRGRESLLGKDVPQPLCHLDHVVSGHSDLLGKVRQRRAGCASLPLDRRGHAGDRAGGPAGVRYRWGSTGIGWGLTYGRAGTAGCQASSVRRPLRGRFGAAARAAPVGPLAGSVRPAAWSRGSAGRTGASAFA